MYVQQETTFSFTSRGKNGGGIQKIFEKFEDPKTEFSSAHFKHFFDVSLTLRLVNNMS
jgi:hypothetical protein